MAQIQKKLFGAFFQKSTACLLILLSSCCAGTHAPPFATVPYETFSRVDAVAIATDEWRLWGQRVDDSGSVNYEQSGAAPAQFQPGLWERVGEYWWEGMNASEPDAAFTGKHDARGDVFPAAQKATYAWSAAFICYVMRMAGAGPHFPYAPDHAAYIDYAARAAQGLVRKPLLMAENPENYAPRLGDLVCFPRGWARDMVFADLPARKYFPAHCAIVVGGGPGVVSVIGGNVDDAVTLQHLHANAAGELAGNRYNWFVVLRVMYAR